MFKKIPFHSKEFVLYPKGNEDPLSDSDREV